jgi:hypothetical protein
MFMGWRMNDDLATFARLPDGQLSLNILEGTCAHSEAGSIETHIAKEIREWFRERLRRHNIPLSDVLAASLTVQMKNTLPSKHKRGIMYDWTCDALIRTSDREYAAHLAEPHTWIPMP